MGIWRLRSKNLLDSRLLEHRGESRIGFCCRELGITFVLRLAEIDHTAFQVTGFGERLRQQVVKPSAVIYGTILQQRPAPRTVVLEQLRIQCQRLAERGDG